MLASDDTPRGDFHDQRIKIFPAIQYSASLLSKLAENKNEGLGGFRILEADAPQRCLETLI
jgi:hypothetical protein